jgi:hypothetical protein
VRSCNPRLEVRIFNGMSSNQPATGDPPEYGYLQSDEPITRRSEDRLNRARLAEAIAEQVLHSPRGQGFVIALNGPWGSGKTSVLNMIEESVEEASATVVLRFNPWLFSGTEQLVGRFLQELSAQLGEKADEGGDERLRKLGERLAGYGDVLVPLGWVPLLGPWLSRAGALAVAFGRRPKEKPQPSALAEQRQIRAALEELGRRILVIVDDLDRIEPDQIRDVVRLIKLVADFPNVTYLVAYDAEKVAAALADDVQTGREYLEKIRRVGQAVRRPCGARRPRRPSAAALAAPAIPEGGEADDTDKTGRRGDPDPRRRPRRHPRGADPQPDLRP